MPSSRLTLTAKLAAINLLLVASLAAVLAAALRILPADLDAADGMAQLGRAQRANQNADMLHDALHAGLLGVLLAPQLPGVEAARIHEQLAQDASEFRSELGVLSAMALPADVSGPLATTRAAGLAYVAQVERLARLAAVDPAQAVQSMASLRTDFDAAKQALARQTQVLARAMDDAHARSLAAAARSRLALIAAALLAVAVGVSCVALIGRSIRRSLAELRDVARDVAQGDLDRRSANADADEVGQLAAAVNRMAAHLQDMIGRVREEADRGGFRAELAQALDMADSEAQACEAAGRAMLKIAVDQPMELLVADSSDAHLMRAAQHPAAGAPGCTVESPYGCVAVRSGHAMRFPDADALSACPRLRGRAQAARSAACVPVTFMGRALGVLHVAAPAGREISEPQFDRLAALGVQVGGRIGTVRAFERTQLQASTDALTGLANRRVVEARLRDLTLRREPYVLVLCDLDHFKRLNDTFGHPAGDGALRCFAEVVRGSMREGDLAGRWGGEEFAFVLAGMPVEEGLAWADRVRERLADTLSQRTTPAFTASFGVAASSLGESPEAVVRLADEALYRAKREGRDRAALAQPGVTGIDTVVPLRREPEAKAGVDPRQLADKR